MIIGLALAYIRVQPNNTNSDQYDCLTPIHIELGLNAIYCCINSVNVFCPTSEIANLILNHRRWRKIIKFPSLLVWTWSAGSKSGCAKQGAMLLAFDLKIANLKRWLKQNTAGFSNDKIFSSVFIFSLSLVLRETVLYHSLEICLKQVVVLYALKTQIS